MRITNEQADFLEKEVLTLMQDAQVYLFGSRTDDQKRGGDIDIMVLSDKRLTWKEKAMIRWHYFEKFGEQKLDIISSTFNERNPFKEIVLHEGIRL